MLLNHFKPVLCIIDTQARVTVGAEENSSRDMGKFVHSLEHLRAGQATTMFPVHHEPRNGENLRGSVALEGAAMSIIRSSKEGDAVTVSCPKQKDVPEPQDIELTLYPIDNSAVLVEQNPITSTTLTETEWKMLRTLAGFPGGKATATDFKDRL